MSLIATLLNSVLTALLLAIFVRSILSWFPMSAGNPFKAMLDQITEPVLMPIRRLMPRTGTLDLSPMIAILIIILIQSLLQGFR